MSGWVGENVLLSFVRKKCTRQCVHTCTTQQLIKDGRSRAINGVSSYEDDREDSVNTAAAASKNAATRIWSF